MSLRTRLAIGVTALTLLTLSLGGIWARQSAAREMERGTDRFLTERSQAFTGPEALTFEEHLDLADGAFDQARALFAESDAVTQLVSPEGAVAGPDDQIVLPVVEADLALRTGDDPVIRNQRVGETEMRVLTAPLPEGGLVQIGRDLTEADAVLANLTLRLAIGGVLTSTVLAVAAWYLVRRSLRPLETIAAATEQLAQDQARHDPLPTIRNDEIGRLARSFNTMTEALVDSRLRQQRLVEDAGHELRTPLASLLTSAEVLAHGEAVPAERRAQLLGHVAQESQELARLIDQLIDLAAGSDRLPPRSLEAVPLSAIAAGVVERSRQRYPQAVYLTREGANQPVKVEADSIGRAVANLVDNAAKFSAENGTIEVVVDDRSIEVRDRGAGIDQNEIDRIFERFHRSPEARNLPGSGLGLAIVRHVAEQHGGQVWAENRPGGGAALGFSISADRS